MSDNMKVGGIKSNDYEQTAVQPVRLYKKPKINSIHEAATSANMSVRMAAMQLPGLLNGSTIQNTETASYT